jgi:hypothetical protein
VGDAQPTSAKTGSKYAAPCSLLDFFRFMAVFPVVEITGTIVVRKTPWGKWFDGLYTFSSSFFLNRCDKKPVFS